MLADLQEISTTVNWLGVLEIQYKPFLQALCLVIPECLGGYLWFLIFGSARQDVTIAATPPIGMFPSSLVRGPANPPEKASQKWVRKSVRDVPESRPNAGQTRFKSYTSDLHSGAPLAYHRQQTCCSPQVLWDN